MEWLPAAEKNAHGRALSWAEKSDPKGCLHTTESSDWPTYRDWTVNPHATIKPSPGKGVTVRQHIPFDQASFALRNLAGGVETNRDYVFQFELIGTSEKGGPGYYWPGADDAVLLDLYRKVVKPLSVAYKIPMVAPTFQAYPASYGARGKTNTVRLSGSAFDDYSGWLGHQHVPENVHGDPGAFPWDRMMTLGRRFDAVNAPEQEGSLMVTKDDEVKIRKIVADEMDKAFERFLDKRSIENIPADGGEKGPDWQPRRLFANMDLKLDRIGSMLANLTTNSRSTPPTSGQ